MAGATTAATPIPVNQVAIRPVRGNLGRSTGPMRAVSVTVRALALALALTTVATQVVTAAVWTDHLDYSPGSVVTISGDNSDGAGYVAGETVDAVVTGPNGYAASCSATAAGNGAWSCQ